MANEPREPSIPLPGERSGASSRPAPARAGSPSPFDGGSDREPRSERSEARGEPRAEPRAERTARVETADVTPAAPHRSGGRAGIAVAALVIGLLLGAGGWALIDSMRTGDAFAGVVDSNRYQAVILTNDKVYFGRVTNANDTFFRLDDAFFLRETQDNANATPVRSLLPINRELHAPENRMLIRKDEVVLVENLATDSPVLTEIRRQKGGK